MSREEFLEFISNTFGNYGLKNVSATDVSRSAYVPNRAQRDIMTSLSIQPIHNIHIQLKELFSNNILNASYYPSERTGSGRTPEIRMGLNDLISYLSVGDEVLFTTDNNNIFIYNLSKLNTQENIQNDEQQERIFSQVDINLLRERVQNINTVPTQEQRQITVYSRNNALRAFIKTRSNYSCEMPNCNYEGFEKSNGEKYIEVHHLTPLSEGGEDSPSNTIALCPTCHRKMHYAANKSDLKNILEEYLQNLD